MMKKVVLVGVLAMAFLGGMAQPMSKCFEIERILVDACSEPEGENEMVYLQIGNAALNTADLDVAWPTVANNWLGTCKNGQTALKTDSLNNSIQACGRLIEPTGGILPAGAKVILITSTNVQALANSFANLNDTVYVIYQCSGNTNGHFGNTGSSSPRRLYMTFNGGGGCSDTAIYDRSLLVNINGTTGGGSTLQDGSSVAFAWDGTATYYNNGCVAPFTPSFVDAGGDTSVCAGTPIQLNGAKQGIGNIRWSSTQGTFDTATILNPVFTPQTGASVIAVILSGFNACDTIYDTLQVNLSSGTPPQLTIDKTLICASDSALICAPSGYASYQWNNGKTTNCFYTNQAGNYYVQVQNGGGCGATSTPVSLAVRPQPSVSIVRQGDTLSSYGAVSYQWMLDHSPISGATSAVYIARESGLYSVQITDNFGCKATSTDIEIFISGLEEVVGDHQVEVYPNPASGMLQVEVTDASFAGGQFILFDALGRKTIQQAIFGQSAVVNVSQLSKGTYVWAVEKDAKVSGRGKVLIR